jgi:hypothetical protein
MRRILFGVVVCGLVAAGLPPSLAAEEGYQARAEEGQEAPAEESYGAQVGWGTLAMGANLLYMPAKLVYVLLGGMTGGLAYLMTFGDEDAARLVWSPSLGGTYVITPAMVRGHESILYSGESYERGERH